MSTLFNRKQTKLHKITQFLVEKCYYVRFLHGIIMNTILNRGVVDLIPPTNKSILNVKAGFDPTSPHLHLGHCVLLKKLKDFQDQGHNVIIIIGDFTAMIGDPTGKNSTRPQLSQDQVDNNAKTFLNQIFKILDKSKTTVRFNSEWWNTISAADMIKLTSSVTVSRMLDRDDFKKRFETHSPISLHEFQYPLLQGHDSVVIKSDLELGGTDQLFNLHMGRMLQEKASMIPQGILTMPILLGTDGKLKMSKSLNNTINMDDDAFLIRQKILNMPDSNVDNFLLLLSDVKNSNDSIIVKKEILVIEILKLLNITESGVMTISIKEESLPVTALLNRLNIAKNSATARDLVSKNAVFVDDNLATLETRILTGTDFKLKAGKKQSITIRVIKENE